MSSLLVILIGTVLVDTFLLMQNDEALSGTRQGGGITSAMRIAGGTFTVLTVSALTAHSLWQAFESLPSDALLFLYALMVVAVAVLLDRVTRNRFLVLERALARSPLLVVGNSIALGTGMLPLMSGGDTATVLLNVCTLGISFIAALTLFVALVSRITAREVPVAFRSAPITLVSAGLLTLALMGFTGLLRG